MNTIKNNNNLVYRTAVSKQEIWEYLKTIILPSGVLFLCFFTIIQFAGFGKSLLSPMILLMWGVGVVTAFLLPSMRTSILRETLTTVGIYCATMFILRTLVIALSGTSAGALAASFDLAVPETSGTAAVGYLQNAIYLGSVLTPLGFIGMQVKKVFTLKRNNNKVKTLNRLRNIRDENKNMQ